MQEENTTGVNVEIRGWAKFNQVFPNHRNEFPASNNLNIMCSVYLCSVLQKLPRLGGVSNMVRIKAKPQRRYCLHHDIKDEVDQPMEAYLAAGIAWAKALGHWEPSGEVLSKGESDI